MSDGIVGAENGMAETWISGEDTAGGDRMASSARTAAAFAAPSVSASTSVPSARS